MRETLPVALKLMFGHEGGYSNVKTDKGGPTKYGVTHKTLAAHRGVRACSAADVKALTLEEATQIYVTGYWAQAGGDVLPRGLDYAAFDFAVNSGPARAVRVLQRLLGQVEDGNIGPQTLAAVRAYHGGVTALISAYCEARMQFLRGIKGGQGFSVNGRGWTVRVTGKDPLGKWKPQPGVLGHALKLALTGAAALPLDVPAAPPLDVPAPGVEPLVEGETAKAEPTPTHPVLNKEVLTTAGSVVAGVPAILSVPAGPLQYAVGFAVVVVVLIGAFYVIKLIRKQPV